MNRLLQTEVVDQELEVSLSFLTIVECSLSHMVEQVIVVGEAEVEEVRQLRM